ncbi:MAG: putative quinol monooxygenase [Chloroflexota bacterium]
MAHTAIAVFACKRGKDPEFLEMLVNALAETRAFATCRAVERYVDQDNPDVTVLWEKWEDHPRQEAYRAWRVQPGMVDMIGPFPASPLRNVHLSNGAKLETRHPGSVLVLGCFRAVRSLATR